MINKMDQVGHTVVLIGGDGKTMLDVRRDGAARLIVFRSLNDAKSRAHTMLQDYHAKASTGNCPPFMPVLEPCRVTLNPMDSQQVVIHTPAKPMYLDGDRVELIAADDAYLRATSSASVEVVRVVLEEPGSYRKDVKVDPDYVFLCVNKQVLSSASEPAEIERLEFAAKVLGFESGIYHIRDISVSPSLSFAQITRHVINDPERVRAHAANDSTIVLRSAVSKCGEKLRVDLVGDTYFLTDTAAAVPIERQVIGSTRDFSRTEIERMFDGRMRDIAAQADIYLADEELNSPRSKTASGATMN